MAEVKKKRRRGYTRLSAKNQVTIPVDELRGAGLKAGDELRVRADGPGRLVLVREDDVLARYAGTLTYPKGYLKQLRDEWDVK
jgi:bifunctional DNA-binding transcriptional regulator/antitoxin component of YhaV-PrlF toxin-antitoxin module